VKSVTLAFVGDVMLGRAVNETIPARPPEAFWGDVLPVLRAADAVFANLECTITEHQRRWSLRRKMFHFRADPAAADVLAAANVRFVSLANNHVLDFEEQGLRDTLRHLDAAGIAHAGAGRDLEEATRPAMVDVGGFKVGVISLTDNEPLFAAKPGRPGTYYTEIRADPETLDPIAERAAHLRAEGADLVVVSAHWGPNMVANPRPRFQSFARAVLEAGVDLFHGHSAHVFQGVELKNEGLILYDTGDFLDDYIVDPELRNDWSFVFLVETDGRGLRRLRLVPVKLGFARVDLAVGAESEAIVELMRERSAGFGTPLAATDEGLELTIRP
jgi:poly-gamma-glutamate synthesis protein (capsule biosynthesis protein)